MDSVDPELGEEEYCCRICFDETKDRQEVIVPCLCSGSGKYICKDCLQNWRVNGATARSFTHCPTCGFEYHLDSQDPVDHFKEGTICLLPAQWFGRTSYFRYLVFSDFLLGFFTINTYLIVVAIFIRWIDTREHMVDLMPWDDFMVHDQNEHLLKAFKHHKATYYSASILVNIFLFGIYASMQRFFTCRVTVHKLRHSVRHWRKLNRTKLVLLLIVLFFIKFFVGTFFALISMVAWMQKAATRHMHVLEIKEIANEFQVVDLELAGRLKYKKILGSEESVSASAPPKSHHLASSNLMARLLRYKVE